MKKWFWVPVAVVAVAGLVSVAWSEPRSGFKFWKADKLVEKLGLSEPQIQQLEEIWYQHRKSSIEIEARIKSARLTFDHLLIQDKVDEKQLESLAGEIGAARKEQVESSLRQMVEFRKVLTAEQWEECERGKRAREGRVREGEGRMPRPRPEGGGKRGGPPLPEPKAD